MKSQNKLLIGCLVFIFVMISLLIMQSVSAEPYNIDEDMQLNENQIYNISNANSSNFYQGIFRVLDENSTLNVSNINVSNENVNSSLYSNRTTFWGTLEGVSNITGLLMSQISDIWSTVVESIVSSDVYIILSGTTGNVTVSLNTTKLNETITVIVTESNTSMKEYVDTQDVTFNESMKDYVIANNGSMKSYVDLNNATQAAEISAKHTPGVCAAGEAVQNTTTGGVECIALTTDTKWPINTTVLSNQSGTLGIVGTFWSNIYATLADTFSRSVIISNFLNITDQRYNETIELDAQITQQEADNTTQADEISAKDSWSDPVDADIIPDTNNVYNLGNGTKGFNYGYLGAGLRHTDNTDNFYLFGIHTQSFFTGGSVRMILGNTGMQLGNAGPYVTTIYDQDDMSSNSPTALATQQSIKAYADSILTPSVVTVANTDRIVITDASDDGIIKAGPQFIMDTTTFLRNDGTWAIPSGGDTQWPLNTTVMQNESGTLGIVGTFWSNIYATLADTFSRSVIVANFLNISDQRYNETSELDSQITQQQNDNTTQSGQISENTDLINAVNTTANIEKLGFVTGAHTTGSDVVNWVGNWSEDKSDYYTSSETDTAIENSNDSLKSYVDTRDIFYNSSIINHTNETFIAKASEEDLNVNSSDYWDDNANPSDIQDELLISCGNISGATSNLCTITPTAGSQWTINTTVLSNQSGILGIVGTYWSNIYATLADTFSRSVIIANFLNITDQRYNETSELDSQITQQEADNATQAAVILANNNTQSGEITANTNLANAINTSANIVGLGLYLSSNQKDFYNDITNFTGTLTNTKTCIYTTGTGIVCDTTPTVGTVTSVTGTSPVVSSGGATPAISIPVATSIADGYLSSGDWSTFNDKSDTVGTVTSVGASSPIVSSGGATPSISATILKDLVTTAPLTGAVDNVFLGADADITIAMPVATTSADGYLSQTDWDTFNNKASSDTTYSAGDGISESSEVFTVAGGTALTQDAGGLSVTDNAIGNTQLEYDTGQALTSTSNPTFATLDTGQGANELYDMDQNVLEASDVTFNNITSTNLLGDTDPANHQIYDNATCWIMKAGTTTFEVCE